MVICVASCEIGLLLMECSRRSESGSDMAPPRPHLRVPPSSLPHAEASIFFFAQGVALEGGEEAQRTREADARGEVTQGW